MTTVASHTVRVPDHVLEDLRRRLAATRWPESETAPGWGQGVPLQWARDTVDYWLRVYDWRRAEARLNAIPQFTTELDGLRIHLFHQRSPHPEATPLLLTHGWPGTVMEFTELIGPLTDPVAHGGRPEDAFHVVCPSLPGYGFSERPSCPGWGVERIARAWDMLMERLGYDAYGAHGGDWGAAVTTQLGRDGGGCIAIHTTMPIVRPPTSVLDNPTDRDRAALARIHHQRRHESAYARLQRSKPQTIGYALTDSPVGQLAWIAEKYRTWTDCDGDLTSAIELDTLLDCVTLYWATQTAASSARLYAESYGAFGVGPPVRVPTGVASFPAEIVRPPRHWVEPHYNVTWWTDMPRGGHFPALEEPDLLVADLRGFFATVQ